ncbi:protein-glutamine gamma-glutamyltransferase K [Latimeria chalumnae]|uniref:protein-glutamine gamma-glutamyltransferase K n=1 Tax=Latimeria chalumnae TaxID=7897 RepID=UPI00313E6141
MSGSRFEEKKRALDSNVQTLEEVQPIILKRVRRDSGPSAVGENILTVKSINLLKGKEEINKKSHHTDEFEYDELIVRRGQSFHIKLELSRPFNPEADKLLLEMHLGPKPQFGKGTLAIVRLVQELDPKSWSMKIVKVSDRVLTLKVNSSPEAPIGRYQLIVKSLTLNEEFRTKHNPDDDIYILFNPWCKADTVYMEDEERRKEYVLNDTGKLYRGMQRWIGASDWNFGQFDQGILEACFFLLDKGKMPHAGRGDPISMVRVVSAMINSADDDGVLVGNWSGDYSDGITPMAWGGSVEILLGYYSTGGEPVSFGQCWVFSGLTTTVLRCFGIPTRSVTNFDSAHDTDVSLSMDTYYDEDMEEIRDLNSDSVWNFHVWNDCWMARPDLPPGYGGWQAVDATPQETSSGTYCCGPASLRAIKNGLVFLKYDAPFIFAEVNCDRIYWQRKADGTFEKFDVVKNAVGHKISTKAVGSDEREDITHLYKYQEGSEEERISVQTACQYGTKPNLYRKDDAANDVTADIKAEDKIQIGSDVMLKISLGNRSMDKRTVSLFVQSSAILYTGVNKGTFKREQEEIVLGPCEVKEMVKMLKFEEYDDHLVEHGSFMFTILGRVKETKQVFVKQDHACLSSSSLKIMILGQAEVDREVQAKFEFTNSQTRRIRNVQLRIEGPGLQKPKTIYIGDIRGNQTMSHTEMIIPSKPGARKLIATLDSHQLITEVQGFANVYVKKPDQCV